MFTSAPAKWISTKSIGAAINPAPAINDAKMPRRANGTALQAAITSQRRRPVRQHPFRNWYGCPRRRERLSWNGHRHWAECNPIGKRSEYYPASRSRATISRWICCVPS